MKLRLTKPDSWARAGVWFSLLKSGMQILLIKCWYFTNLHDFFKFVINTSRCLHTLPISVDKAVISKFSSHKLNQNSSALNLLQEYFETTVRLLPSRASTSSMTDACLVYRWSSHLQLTNIIILGSKLGGLFQNYFRNTAAFLDFAACAGVEGVSNCHWRHKIGFVK